MLAGFRGSGCKFFTVGVHLLCRMKSSRGAFVASPLNELVSLLNGRVALRAGVMVLAVGAFSG